ncbi:MAG: putative lexA repressor [Planctomycetaceae bacterium]|nr:putative lexA repressor [Planctomycetaceae bacterium]
MARKKTAPAIEPLQAIKFDATKKAEVLAKSAATTAGFAASALMAAELIGIETKRLEHFTLSLDQREVLLHVPSISKSIKSKLAKPKASFTVAEVASMTSLCWRRSNDNDCGTRPIFKSWPVACPGIRQIRRWPGWPTCRNA